MSVRRAAAFAGLAHILRTGPLPWLLWTSLGGFVAMASVGGSAGLSSLCSARPRGLMTETSALPMTTAWIAMLIVMMPPLLAQPIAHVWISVFRRLRPLALAMFGLGYGAAWIPAGIVLVPAAGWLRGWSDSAGVGIAMIAIALVAVALTWSASPTAQAARNRCHRTRPIRPFGRLAGMDGFAYGLDIGVPCVAACWPWMLLPMAVTSAHLAAMALAMLLVFLERLAPATSPAWQIPPALKMVAALI